MFDSLDHRFTKFLLESNALKVHQAAQCDRVGAHGHTAMRHVRAAHVDFKHVRVGSGELFDDLRVVVVAMARDVRNDGSAEALEDRQGVLGT